MRAIWVVVLAGIIGASHGLSARIVEAPCKGVVFAMNEREFFTAYARVFHMSDGSSIDIPRQDSVFPQSIHGRSLKYMQTMLASLGIAPGQEGDLLTFSVCADNIMDIFFLAVTGNFVTSPTDPDLAPSSSIQGLATIVIDVFTGTIIMINSFNVIRTYLLEALLVVSVVAIARLAVVRKVVEKIAVVSEPAKQKT